MVFSFSVYCLRNKEIIGIRSPNETLHAEWMYILYYVPTYGKRGRDFPFWLGG